MFGSKPSKIPLNLLVDLSCSTCTAILCEECQRLAKPAARFLDTLYKTLMHFVQPAAELVQSGAIVQRTIRETVRFVGVCLHSGRHGEAILAPARANTGVVFRSAGRVIRADAKLACTRNLTTTLKHKNGWNVHSVEHLLAALAAYRVDNIVVHVPGFGDACSIPILDGSSRLFVDKLEGNIVPAVNRQGRMVGGRVVVVEKPVQVEDDGRYARLSPLEGRPGLELDVTIDFDSRIRTGEGSHQHVQFYLPPEGREAGPLFREFVAPARTFCFEADIAAMRARGLGRGGSLENAVVFSANDGSCINPGGLRFRDEPCRHKLLDCIGDLALCPRGVLYGRFETVRPGHDLNRRVMLKLLSDPMNFSVISVLHP